MSAKPFIVTYKNLRKAVQCKECANIYDDVALKFSNCLIFPRRIKLQYEDKEVNDFIDRSSRPQVFCKKGVLRNFTKFTLKNTCARVSFLVKLLAGLQLYLKKDSGTGVFL